MSQPIVLASQEGDVNALREALSGKSAAFLNNLADKWDGWTPLHYSIRAASLACVDLLLTHGALPNPKTQTGETPLMIAAREGYTDICQRLLQSGADPSIRNAEKESAIRSVSSLSSLIHSFIIIIIIIEILHHLICCVCCPKVLPMNANMLR